MKSSATFLFALTILVSLSCNQDKSKDFATAQKTCETMIAAVQEGDAEKFIDCLDLQFLIKEAKAQSPGAQITEKQIISFLKTEQGIMMTRKLMNGFNKYQWSVLYETDTGINSSKVAVRVSPKSIYDLPTSEEFELIFIKRGEKWKFDLESFSLFK
jgi:hypothetical protein